MITLYTIGCPACNVLEKKLKQKNLEFIKIEDKETLIEKGFDTFPMLEANGLLMGYTDAVKWVNRQ